MPKGIYQHKPIPEAIKLKMSEAKLKNPVKFWLGKKRPPFSMKWKRNISKGMTGIVFTEEHKKNLSKARIKYCNNK